MTSKTSEKFGDAKESFEKEESIDTSQTESESDSSSDSTGGEPPRVRSIRFADEQGLPMVRVHHLGDNDDPLAVNRLVILLLSPSDKKFEFAHVEYRLRAEATVADLLQQLPAFATSELFTTMEFESLYRTQCEDPKLDSSTLLHDIGFGKHEVMVPIRKGFSGEDIVKCAVPLLLNKRIIKGVSSLSLIVLDYNGSVRLTSIVSNLALTTVGEICQAHWKRAQVRQGP
jgi:hypothetical protein